MPFTADPVFATFKEDFEVSVRASWSEVNPNYSLQQPPTTSPSLGEGLGQRAVWRRTVSIVLHLETSYEEKYNGAFSGYDVDAATMEVTETWTKLSGNPWTATYTNTTLVKNTAALELGNQTTIGLYIPFSVRADGVGSGSVLHRVLDVEIFGETADFFAHSYSSGGYSLSAGGSTMLATCPGFAGDDVRANNYWRPTMDFRVKAEVRDLEGNPLLKDVLLYFGKAWALGDSPFRDDLLGASDDLSDYLIERTTPVDELFTIVGLGMQFERRVIQNGTTVYNYLIPTTYPGSIDGQAIQSQATHCRVVFRYSNFGMTPGAYPFYEVQNQVDFEFKHEWVEDADSSDVLAATVTLPLEKDFSLGAWSASGSGASAVGSTLSAGATEGTFTALLSPRKTGSPYRWLAFDYVVDDGNPSIELEAVGADDLGSGGVFEGTSKRYNTGPLEDSGTVYIDTINPKMVGTLPASSMAKLEVVNQAQLNPLFAATGRFGGLRNLYSFKLRFSNATVSVSNFRMVVREVAEIWHRAGTSDLAPGENQHFMAGHVDGRDAFRIDRPTIKTTVDGLSDWQNLDIVSESYSLPAHAPFASLEDLGSDRLAVLTQSLSIQPSQSLLANAQIRATCYSGEFVFFYGLRKCEWFESLQCWAVWGNEAAATIVGRETDVRVMSPTSPVFDFTYASDPDHGFGLQNLPEFRHLRPGTEPRDVEHYVPGHPAPQTKATYYLDAAGRRYHVYALQELQGGGSVSYDVSSSLRHYRAYIKDGTVWTGYSDNTLAWTDHDTEIEAESVCIRIARRGKEQVLHLWTGSSGSIEHRTSSDEGENWSMPTLIASGTTPAAEIGLNGRRYVYWIDGADVKGQIYDASGSVLQNTFTAIEGVDDSGLSVSESVVAGGKHRIVILCVVGGVVTSYESFDGINFS